MSAYIDFISNRVIRCVVWYMAVAKEENIIEIRAKQTMENKKPHLSIAIAKKNTRKKALVVEMKTDSIRVCGWR